MTKEPVPFPASLTRPGVGDGKSDILEAAADRFASRGYVATTIDDIADELGATKGRIYHYYRSKADIFLDVLHVGMEELLARAQRIAQDASLTAEQRLYQMAHNHATLMMTRNSFQRVAVEAVKMHLAGNATIKQQRALQAVVRLRDDYEQLFADVLTTGQAQGEFRKVENRLATKPILGALNWISLWYHPRYGDQDIVDDIAGEFAHFIVSGMRA